MGLAGHGEQLRVQGLLLHGGPQGRDSSNYLCVHAAVAHVGPDAAEEPLLAVVPHRLAGCKPAAKARVDAQRR